jgi:endonuclease YncB( thermonuclease family)
MGDHSIACAQGCGLSVAMRLQWIIFVIVVIVCGPAVAEPLKREDMAVVDAVTIRAHGKTYRLMGFDAAETATAKCPAERELGERAVKRLTEIAGFGGLDLTEVPCACLPGTIGTRLCNQGKLCGVLRAGGGNVGLRLITEGLARPYYCGKYRCPKRRSWC